MHKGKLILIVGLPGSGKGTLIAHLKSAFPELIYPVSWTTRPPRPGEREGDVYHFASEEEFLRSAEAGEFLEWVTIDTGHKYGTRKKELLDPIQRGKFVLREVEVQGARAIRDMLPEGEVETIFVNTNSWEDLEKRITKRAPIAPDELAARKARYEKEVAFKDEANHVVENRYGELEAAKRSIEEVMRGIIRSS